MWKVTTIEQKSPIPIQSIISLSSPTFPSQKFNCYPNISTKLLENTFTPDNKTINPKWKLKSHFEKHFSFFSLPNQP